MSSNMIYLLQAATLFGVMHIGIKTYVDLNSPRIYDVNSTRQILKFGDIDGYCKKEAEYFKVKSRLMHAVRSEDQTPTTIADILIDLRLSPFYDAKACAPMYKSLWKLQAKNESNAPVSELAGAPCTKGKGPDATCSKMELMKDLLGALR